MIAPRERTKDENLVAAFVSNAELTREVPRKSNSATDTVGTIRDHARADDDGKFCLRAMWNAVF
jgi:hypothetical protein